MYLIYHQSTGLREVRKFPSRISAGTYVGSAVVAISGGRSNYWELRIKCKTSGHTWETGDELPKQLRLEALLLGVVL